jgi:hypothetical protein
MDGGHVRTGRVTIPIYHTPYTIHCTLSPIHHTLYTIPYPLYTIHHTHPSFLQYGVDVHITAHQHVYERTTPVYRYQAFGNRSEPFPAGNDGRCSHAHCNHTYCNHTHCNHTHRTDHTAPPPPPHVLTHTHTHHTTLPTILPHPPYYTTPTMAPCTLRTVCSLTPSTPST